MLLAQFRELTIKISECIDFFFSVPFIEFVVVFFLPKHKTINKSKIIEEQIFLLMAFNGYYVLFRGLKKLFEKRCFIEG